jgi:hydroxymethylglutaryl-CoA lyase
VVKIVECPRDAWQGLPIQIAPEVKAGYLRELVEAGFRHIDAVSFVSPTAVPQMADSEDVLRLLGPCPGVEIIGIVANLRGAERAINTGAVQTLGFPYSISPRFLLRNQRQAPDEALRALAAIGDLAFGAGLDVVAYISMAFGNPYGDDWSSALVMEACDRLADAGVKTISLADTVGVATLEAIAETVAGVLAEHSDMEIGVHLHTRPTEAAARIRVAYDAGCRRFDAAIGGLGGCPFAQDELVGNIPTEALIDTISKLGAELPELRSLDGLLRANAAISRDTVSVVQ